MAHKPNKIYQNDYGTIILLHTGSDISAATITDIKVRKPDGTDYIWSGSIDNIKYVKYTILGAGSGYQECGMNIISGDPSGLSDATAYSFTLNEKEYIITTSTSPTYADVVALMDTELDTDGFDAIISGNDIRIDNRLTGEDSIVLLTNEGTNDKLFDNLTGFVSFDTPVAPFLGDFDQHGTYYLQAYVEIDGWYGRGETAPLEVYKKFK